MLTMDRLEALSQIAPPVVSAYVCTSPTDATQHALTPAYLPSLKNDGRAIANGLPFGEQELFSKQFNRVVRFLEERVPHERSLVILAGSSTWEEIPLQVELHNEVHWGKPALGQLFWFAGEHKPYGIIAVDHHRARFLLYLQGELAEEREKKFEIDISGWRRKELGHVVGSQRGRGTQRDLFDKRMDSQYARLCDETAREAATFYAQNKLAAMFLAGPDRLIKTIQKKLPQSLLQSLVASDRDLAGLTTAELLKHLQPEIAAWERRHEEDLVRAATAENGAVAGFDEALALFQQRKVRVLLIARGLNPVLHECVQCGWADRSADPVCPVCRGERRNVRFEGILPELLRKQEHKLQIHVVSNHPAEALKGAGGMAAWLRQAKSKKARVGR